MSDLYLRRAIVTIDSLRVEGLRVAFKADKTLKPEPNTLDLKVYNLAKASRAQMQSKGAKVILQAGYQDHVEVVFQGDARTIDHVRSGPDWITHVQCGDGERAYRNSRINASFAPGTKVQDVLRTLVKSLGLNSGNALDEIGKGGFREGFDQFLNGYAASGNSATELTRLLDSAGLDWSIQDGALQVLKDSETAKNTAVLLSAATGMVGSPEHGSPNKRGLASVLKVKSLLQPSVRPGSLVQVEAIGISGLFKAEKVTHQGDTAGPEMYTSVEARPR